MSLTGYQINPFPGPVPPWNDHMGPVNVRGNDNAIATAFNKHIADGPRSVMEFGAKGDGVTDDTAAFNTALSTATVVWVPLGTYLIAGTIAFTAASQWLWGAGNGTILSFTGAGVGINFASFAYCAVKNMKLTTSTATIGIDLPTVSHNWTVEGVHITGYSTAGMRNTSSYYGELSHCDIETNAVGLLGDGMNGNHVHSNSFRQNLIAISLTDTTSVCNGNEFTGNQIESARASSTYAIKVIAGGSNVFQGNRLEYTVGTAHIYVDSSASHVAQFNQFIANPIEGTIPAIILGGRAGAGAGQTLSTTIYGGRAAGAITINSDCTSTVMKAAPGSYPGALTQNGYGSIIEIDPTNGKETTATTAVPGYGYKLTVGGSATIIDSGANNTLQVSGPVGAHTVFAASGQLQVAQGGARLAGDLLYLNDGSNNVGATGASRPAIVYVSNRLEAQGNQQGFRGITGAVDVRLYADSTNNIGVLGTISNHPFSFLVNNTGVWQLQAAGHLVGLADNTYDVGNSGGNRPRTLYFATSIQGPVINPTATQTVVNGSIAGNATFSQTMQGTSYKQVIIYAAGLNGTASYTFPTAFTNTPEVLSQSLAALVTSISTTAVTLTGAVNTGYITLNGW